MRERGIPLLFAVGILCLVIGKVITVVPLVPVIVVVSILLFLFAFAYTDQAMILLIFAMLLSPEIVIGTASHRQNIMVRVDDLLIIVFMLAWLARSALSKNTSFIRKLPINTFIFLYCYSFMFSTMKGMILGDIVPFKGFFYIFKYIEYFMIFFLTASVIKSKAQVISYLKAFIGVLVIVNIYACTQIGSGRVSAPFEGVPGEPNTLGGYQVLLLGIILGLLTHCRTLRGKWPLLGVAAFSLVPFSFTESRASYMAMVVMYLTMVFFAKGRMKAALIGVLLVVVIASFFFFPSVIKERIAYTFIPEYNESVAPVTIGSVALDPSASARITDWVRLLDSWKKRPIMGYGVTGAGFVDSQFISVLVETGIIGFLAFILLLWNLLSRTLRIYKSTRDDLYEGITIGFFSGTMGMIAHAFTANTFIIIRIMEPFWFFAAIVMMVPQLEKAAAAVVSPATDIPQKAEHVRNINFLVNPGLKS